MLANRVAGPLVFDGSDNNSGSSNFGSRSSAYERIHYLQEREAERERVRELERERRRERRQ